MPRCLASCLACLAASQFLLPLHILNCYICKGRPSLGLGTRMASPIPGVPTTKKTLGRGYPVPYFKDSPDPNLVPRACDPREGIEGSGIIRYRKPRILAKIELRIPFQWPIRFLPETDYPRAFVSFPRIAGSGNEIARTPVIFK